MSIPLPFGNTKRITPQGFTLVATTIIVVLAALSTLGVSKVRPSARGANCTSTLRQIGAAMLAYATYKNGQLPPLEDRTGSGNGLTGIWTNIITNGGNGVAEGTVMQVMKSSVPGSGSLRLTQIPTPERTWLVGDVESLTLNELHSPEKDYTIFKR